jgi:hypothetical protein
MNWGEFKKAVEAQGVEDSSKISYIDVQYDCETENLSIGVDEDGTSIIINSHDYHPLTPTRSSILSQSGEFLTTKKPQRKGIANLLGLSCF